MVIHERWGKGKCQSRVQTGLPTVVSESKLTRGEMAVSWSQGTQEDTKRMFRLAYHKHKLTYAEIPIEEGSATVANKLRTS